MHNSILRTITRITRTFPQNNSDVRRMRRAQVLLKSPFKAFFWPWRTTFLPAPPPGIHSFRELELS